MKTSYVFICFILLFSTFCNSPTGHVYLLDRQESIYYSLHKEIYRMDYDGSNIELVTSLDNPVSNLYAVCNSPKLSRNGQYLLYEEQGKINPYSNLLYDYSIIHIMNLSSKKVMRFTDETIKDWSPQFSPHSDKIVFCSTRDNKSDIYISDINGNNFKRLTNNGRWNINPQFSPDGSKIVFEPHISGDYDIFIMNADGSDQLQLTDTKWNRNPIFSPDGLQIVYETYYDIYLMNTDGSSKINLTNDYIHEYSPRFSSDGSKIIFITAKTENIESREIHIMDKNGQNRVKISDADRHFEPHFFQNDTKILFTRNSFICSLNTDGSNLKELVQGGNFYIN